MIGAIIARLDLIFEAADVARLIRQGGGRKEEGEEQEDMDEEEVVTFEEFEYKGITYYKDSDGQVYQKDADGDLDDTPIGLWNEAKQKIQKYARA